MLATRPVISWASCSAFASRLGLGRNVRFWKAWRGRHSRSSTDQLLKVQGQRMIC